MMPRPPAQAQPTFSDHLFSHNDSVWCLTMRMLPEPFRYISGLSWYRQNRGSPPKPCPRIRILGSSQNAVGLNRLTSNGSSLTDLTRARASARAYSGLAHILPTQLV